MRHRLTPTLLLLAAATGALIYAKWQRHSPASATSAGDRQHSDQHSSPDPGGGADFASETTGAPALAAGDPEWPSVPFDVRAPDGKSADVLQPPPAVDDPPLHRLGLEPDRVSEIDAIGLLAFKEERRVELWIRPMGEAWRKQKEFPFTAFSGGPGPKLREGDGQIPEGIYRIEYLNPNSSYHLSLKIDYPNAFDRRMARRDGRSRLGGDIFLHGKDVTIGCIPIGDRAIEEVFDLVSLAGRQRVTVIIAPRDFRIQPAAPEIGGIEWESDLYQKVVAALQPFARDATGEADPHSAR